MAEAVVVVMAVAVAPRPECIQAYIEEIPNHTGEIEGPPPPDVVSPPASLAGIHGR